MLRKYGVTASVGLLAFLAGLAVDHHVVTEAQGLDRVFELRTYTTHDGKLQGLLDRFGGGETDIFEKHGMQGVGYWVPAESPRSEDTLVYMLAHESREAARASWAAFGSDPDWATMREASRVDGPLVSNVESLFLDPTDFSPVR
ncbi:MAG: NIPSNAP family protein [Vicinamibacterales bacterium]|jgi:hypothetical protein|nr:NIPSNAP family protein [Vicinamibacterales bacterium]